MSEFGFVYELHVDGKRILTQSVAGTRMGVMLEHVAKTVADYERQLGSKPMLKVLGARLNETTTIEDPDKLESLNTLLTMAVEHYHLKGGKLMVETRLENTASEKLTENLKKILGDPKKFKKLVKALSEEDKDEKLDLPSLQVGDTLLVGKFKNRRAEITGFDKDEHNQPVAKTTKGDQKIFKPRIAKLMQQNESVFDAYKATTVNGVSGRPVGADSVTYEHPSGSKFHLSSNKDWSHFTPDHKKTDGQGLESLLKHLVASHA